MVREFSALRAACHPRVRARRSRAARLRRPNMIEHKTFVPSLRAVDAAGGEKCLPRRRRPLIERCARFERRYDTRVEPYRRSAASATRQRSARRRPAVPRGRSKSVIHGLHGRPRSPRLPQPAPVRWLWPRAAARRARGPAPGRRGQARAPAERFQRSSVGAETERTRERARGDARESRHSVCVQCGATATRCKHARHAHHSGLRASGAARHRRAAHSRLDSRASRSRGAPSSV